jgi:hypothetical protein
MAVSTDRAIVRVGVAVILPCYWTVLHHRSEEREHRPANLRRLRSCRLEGGKAGRFLLGVGEQPPQPQIVHEVRR